MHATDLRTYVGLLILVGVYRSRGEATASLWDAESGRTVFRATMPLKVFHRYSRLLRFNDRQSRPTRHGQTRSHTGGLGPVGGAAAGPLQPGARWTSNWSRSEVLCL